MNLNDIFACDSTDDIDRKLDAQQQINRLGHIDRAVLYLWCGGYSQSEIATMFGYSQQRISQVLAKISKQNG